jgi:RecB family exonuclease
MIALSYSRISDYRTCPGKFRLKYIDKLPNFYEDASKSPHLIRGGNVHKALEAYVIKKKVGENDIPVSSLKEVEETKPLIDNIMDIYEYHPEHKIAINEKFELVDWYSKEAYFRLVADGVGFSDHLLLTDYKTGKVTDYSGSMEKPGQLHFSALIGFSVWPQFSVCKTLYIFVDHKIPYPQSFNREQHFERLKEKLIVEHEIINADKNYEFKPNQFCHWCPADNSQCFHSRKSVKGGFAY